MGEKKPTRRDFLKFGAGAAGAAFLAACGSGVPATPAASGNGGVPGSAGSAATTAPAAAAATAVPAAASAAPAADSGAGAVLWGLKYDPHVEAYGRLADLFKKTTGTEIKVEPQDWPLETKMIAALAAGAQPDVVCIMGKVLLPLHLQKALLPLTEAVFKAKGVDPVKDFVGDAIGAYTYQNEIWGVPVESNQVGQVVNVPVDDVKAAGLAEKYPPTNGKLYFESYDDMWALAKALQVTKDGKVTRWGLSSKGWDTQSYLGILRSLGGTWWDNNAKKFGINSDAGIQAMKLFAETPVKMGIETELDQTHVDAALAGKVAIARGNGTPAVQGLDLGYHFELAGAPRVKPGVDPLFIGEGGWGFAAPAKSKHPDVSLKFLQMMCTEEGQMAYAQIYSGLLGYAWAGFKNDTKRFKNDNPNNPNVKASKFYTGLLSQTQYYGEGYGYISQIEKAGGDTCSLVRQGKIDSATAVKQFQDLCEAQYKQFLEDSKKV
ncbi:MAG: extracellular solute-binding protein [Herpetosiphonaceae bacterium]|nr:extracellular solute-binding protein [Herpetosiphonaceae bacterium]